MNINHKQIITIRIILVVFVIGLVISGLTAFPLETELRTIISILPDADKQTKSAFTEWMIKVNSALSDINHRYPFVSYGTDWLAFAHLIIAVAFIGPIKDPVRNIWVIDFGLIACAAVIPMAMIAGEIRGIPLWWRMIDCSFGILGAVPLLLAKNMTRKLIQTQH